MKAVPGREAERGGRNLGPWRAAGSRDIVVAWGPLSFNHNVKEMEIFLSAVVTKVSLLHSAKPTFSTILYMKESIRDIKDLAWTKIRGTFLALKSPSAGCLINPLPPSTPTGPLLCLLLLLSYLLLSVMQTESPRLQSGFFRVVCSGSAHGAVRLWSAPLFCCSPFAQTGHSLLIHLPAEGHLGCSSFGAVRN